MYANHKRFIGWVRKGNFSEMHKSYCEYIKMIGYKDVRALRDINTQLTKMLNHLYNYLGGYDDMAYLKIRHLHGVIFSAIERIEHSNDEAYDTRDEIIHGREYEDED